MAYIAYLPALVFWGLDGYFLYQERLFRNLYNDVRRKPVGSIDFAMNARQFKGLNKATWPRSTMSLAMIIFHGTLLATVVAMTIILIAGTGGTNVT